MTKRAAEAAAEQAAASEPEAPPAVEPAAEQAAGSEPEAPPAVEPEGPPAEDSADPFYPLLDPDVLARAASALRTSEKVVRIHVETAIAAAVALGRW